MKTLLCVTTLFFVFFCYVGCEKSRVLPNPNKASLEFDGILIEFEDIKIENYQLELNAGIGPRALGTSTMENINGFNYYLILDYKKDSIGDYKLHKINFGIKEKLGPMHYYNKVYFASLTEGFNVTNFSHTIATDGLRVRGTFSGRLQSITEGEIEVKNGSFDLDFNTVRDY